MPVALGAVLILAVVAATVATLANSNESSTRRLNTDQRAFALAEGALERAVALLYEAVDPAAATAVPAGSEAEEAGTSSWSGSLAGTTWTLSGTGVLPGENGAGPISRTVTVRYTVSVAGSPWEYLFSDSTGGCTAIADNATVAAPLYVRGDLCLGADATFTGPSLHVEGEVTTGATGSVGTAGTPIASAELAGGCAGGSPDPHPCSAADRVYASSLTAAPGNLTKPALELDSWYAAARPGPSQPCTAGAIPGGFDNDGARNTSRPPFDLSPATAYSCVVMGAGGVEVGRLDWAPGSPGSLVVNGVVYFDGDVTSSGNVVYSGRGTIYSSGAVILPAGARLCGTPGCDGAWSPSSSLLTLVAGGSSFDIQSGAVYQGAAYAADDYRVAAGAENWGPAIAQHALIAGDAVPSVPLATLPPGSPGIATTIHQVPGSWGG